MVTVWTLKSRLPMLWFGIIAAVLFGIGDMTTGAAAASSSPLPSVPASSNIEKSSVLIVGSANADTFLPVARLPTEGENLTLLPGTEPTVDVPGGKGCTQAVAVSKLLSTASTSTPTKCLFIGQLGLDPAGTMLHSSLQEAGVDCSHCGFHPDLSSGRGYVFLQAQTGSVSAVVSGGSNTLGWTEWEQAWEQKQYRSKTTATSTSTNTKQAWEEKQQSRTKSKTVSRTTNTYSNNYSELEVQLERILEEEGVRCVLLQREVPECVNLLIASCVKDHNSRCSIDGNKIVVFQDVGGEDRPVSNEMLKLCDYIVPNESELKRLVESSSPSFASKSNENDKVEVISEYAKELQRLGAKNVLVTMGASGSILVNQDGIVTQQSAVLCKEGAVVDETGAGDCFRAAFAVARIIEGCDTKQAILFASAAGSCSVEVHGAVPSTPDRERILERMKRTDIDDEAEPIESESSSSSEIPRGGESDNQNTPKEDIVVSSSVTNICRPAFVGRTSATGGNNCNSSRIIPRGGDDPKGGADHDDKHGRVFPFLIGSRLNSMKDRPELWQDDKLETPRDYVKRQGTIRGLTCVDFNYPQHFGSSFWTSNKAAKEALDEAGLIAGAVCLRYPSKFARGAMNHPDPKLRREAIELTKEAAEVATELGCDEVVIWSAFDGYDYPFQVNYDEKWDQLVSAFQELCDSFPDIKFSLEYKPTDENTRFFTVPTTGAALLLVEEIDRPNMGLTLDVGHMLMAGENPGQSIAMVGRKQKLFGIQLNDGFTRLAAEDGLMFGSVHPSMALEIMYQLCKTNFKGHLYFDTFPQRSDPVKEAEYNIRQVKRFWYAATHDIDDALLKEINDEHDAIRALELVNNALWNHH